MEDDGGKAFIGARRYIQQRNTTLEMLSKILEQVMQ